MACYYSKFRFRQKNFILQSICSSTIQRVLKNHHNLLAGRQLTVYGIQLFTTGGAHHDSHREVISLGAGSGDNGSLAQIRGVGTHQIEDQSVKVFARLTYRFDWEVTGKFEQSINIFRHRYRLNHTLGALPSNESRIMPQVQNSFPCRTEIT